MITKSYETKRSFKQAVEFYKKSGHVFLGYTWNAAIFKDMILLRTYEE